MTNNTGIRQVAILLVSGLLFSGSVVAAPNERGERHADRSNEYQELVAHGKRGHFNEHQRDVARAYFVRENRAGRCPPGLAKKDNGCNPPGLVKQWQLGQPLPQAVTWYELSRALQRQLGEAPAGYRYAGVDDNILLLELGTQVVVDVIQALGE